jgi:hypothetical protein
LEPDLQGESELLFIIHNEDLLGLRHCVVLLERGFVKLQLQACGPPQKAHQGIAVAKEKTEEARGGDVVRMEQMALLVKDSIGLHPPAHERGAPWREELVPRKTPRNSDHAKPKHHSTISEQR